MSGFTVIPAIDLKGGKCVRLRQGRAEDVTVYSDDPVEMAKRWQAEGAEWVHVVDLDGAFAGHPVHLELIRQIAASVRIPLEVGGGIRVDADLAAALAAGASRVVLGTRALSDRDGLRRAVERHGSVVAVGIDARDGRVQVRGWTETTGDRAVDLARAAAALGVETLIYTDTATDGMLQGPNLAAVSTLCDAVTCGVIASGGVRSAEDIRALKALGKSNLAGAIVGKALYDGVVTLAALRGA